MLVNRVKIYTNLNRAESPLDDKRNTTQIQLESIGNKHSTICCLLNCTSPLSESKDYKTLAKVFEKLMLKIENVYVANINNCKSINFIHFLHEYNFSKLFIFGEDALMDNIPVKLTKFVPNQYELYHILLTENLNILTSSKDEILKRKSWDSIKDFYKL